MATENIWEICWRYVGYVLGISPQHIAKIFTQYLQNILNISPTYPKHIPNKSQKDSQNLPKIFLSIVQLGLLKGITNNEIL